MSTRQTIFCMTVLAAGLISGTSSARADYGFWYPFAPAYTRDYVPYFAAHPPVYYGNPVARSYGWSPYPMPPVLPVHASPLVIENRFVVQSPVAAGEQSQQPVPLRIRNPYVAQ